MVNNHDTESGPVEHGASAVSHYLKISQFAAALFLVGLGICVFLLFQSLEAVLKSGENRHQSYLLADELRQSSDDLTRLVRTFAATGERRFERQFQSVLAIRNGEAPRPHDYNRIYWDFMTNVDDVPVPDSEAASLESIMTAHGITVEEFALLSEAKRKSDELVNLEKAAIRAINGELTVADEGLRLAGESDRDMALRLLHGPSYHEAKTGIMEPINQFFVALDIRTAQEVTTYSHRTEKYLRLSLAMIALFCMAAITSVFARRHLGRVQHEALRANEERLRGTFETNTNGIALHTLDGTYIKVNRAFCEILGYDEHEILGRNWRDFTHPDYLQETEDLDNRVIQGLFQSYTFEKCYVHKDGHKIWTHMESSHLFDSDGNPENILGHITDITQEINIRERLRLAQFTAEQANQAKSDFLASMSHELRTPLNAVIGYSEMLSTNIFGPLGNPKNQEYVEEINNAGIHLLSLINDILDLSKIEAGKEEVFPLETDIHSVLMDCLVMVDLFAEERRIQVVRDIPDFLPTIFVDPRHLSQMFINILSNAIKFTPKEGRVGISVKTDTGRALSISISDTGVGISAEELPKVMENFHRAGPVMTRTHKGTGLGLPLVKRLVDLNGGTFSIESTLGIGTTVQIRFEY